MTDNSNRNTPGSGPDSARSSSLSPGSLLSHTYEIVGLLGRGGMGEVYRARHRYMGTEHAIKIILAELASDQRVAGLFQREAQVLRQLRHEAVVAYDGLFSDEHGRVYLAMEFVDGPSLKEALRKGALKPDDVRLLRDRLASGLAAAHEAGVVHRDLSPDNVILPGGRLDQAKIIDFGIAKRTDPEKSTIIGSQFAGKYSYASPEQFGMFGGDVGPKSDMYSLGLILAAAASGKPLPMGTSTVEVVQARQQVPDLSGVPPEIRREIAPMLEPDPKKRPASMGDLVGLGGKGSSRPPKGKTAGRPGEPPAKRTAPRKKGGGRAAAIGLLVLLLLAGGGAGGWWYWQQMQRDGRDAVQAEIDEALAGLECARLSGELAADGTVVVSGRIGSQESRQSLVERLGGIDGVTRVRDYLAVRPCRTEPNEATIQAAVDEVLGRYGCAELSAAVTEEGRVRLFGYIASQADFDAMQQAVSEVEGVAAVDNAVAVRPCEDGPEAPQSENLAAAVRNAVGSPTCGEVDTELTEDNRVLLSGYVSSERERQRVQNRLAGLAGVAGVEGELSVYRWPLCEVAGMGEGEDGPQIVPNHPNGVYEEGERLVVQVTAPDYDAFLYVELFDNQGNVIHMLPSPSHPDNEIPAGETVTLGEEPGRVYPMRGEVGTYMILAAAAPSRLFPLDRGEVEDARGYLSDLQSSLRRVDDQPGPDAAVEVFILTLVPGS